MWNAFAGYRDVYGHLPTAREVNRVRTYLVAKNEHEYELYEEQQEEIAEMKRQQNADAGASGSESEGRRISIG